MDRGAWWAAVHEVAKGRTRLNDFTFTFYFHALEKEIATHSSILAWRIPWTEKPGRLQSTGSQRVGHNRATSLTYLLILFKVISPFRLLQNIEQFPTHHFIRRFTRAGSF